MFRKTVIVRRSFISLALIACFYSFSPASWITNGPYYKVIKAVSVSPQDSNVVFAGAFGWGVFKSTNGGISWVNEKVGLTNTYVRSILAISNATVFCGTNDGVFKSTDGGANWTMSQPTAFSVRGLAYDPGMNSIYAATYGSGLYKTTNQGSSWTVLNVTDPDLSSLQTLSHQWCVAIIGNDSLYVGGSILDIVAGGALFKSFNGGTSWVQVQRPTATGIIRSSVRSIAISPITPSTSLIIGTAFKGVYKSTNGAVTWLGINGDTTTNPLDDKQINAVGFNANYRYAGSDSLGKFYRRTLNDVTTGWLTGSGLPGPSSIIGSISFNPLNTSTIYVGTEGQGVFKSTNDGGTWFAKNSGMLGTAGRIVKRNGNGNIILGTDFGDGLWISTDNGNSWTKEIISTSNTITSFGVTNNPSVIYAGAYGTGVFKSVDAGINWIVTDTTIINHAVRTISVHPSDLNTAYAGTGNGVYKTINGGASWLAASTGIPSSTSIRSMTLSTASPNVLYVGTDSNYVYKSIDAGGSWSHITNANGFLLQDIFIRCLTIDYANANIVYAGSDSGRIYKTINAGTNWTLLASLPITHSVRSVVIHPNNHNIFFAATFGDGIFVSPDSGVHWASFNGGLTDLEIYSLECDNATPVNLYAGTGSNGVFHTTYAFVNHPPVITPVGNKSGLPNQVLSFTVSAVDPDLTIPSFSILGLPSGAGFTDNGNGSGSFSWTPTLGQIGQYVMSFIASDGLLADTEVVTINVLDPATSTVIHLPVQLSWNMVSIPVIVSDARKTTLFPPANSSAFTYQGSYAVKETLSNGVGYWLKFPSGQTVDISGGTIMLDTIDMRVGWNMVGSISNQVSRTTQIQSILPLVIVSNFFGYNGSYVIADTLKPGKAYWVKVNQAGKIVLNASLAQTPAMVGRVPMSADGAVRITDGFNSISFIDAQGRQGEIFFTAQQNSFDLEQFDLPPLPPQGMFDVRFRSGRMTEALTDDRSTNLSILISSAVYPVTIRWNIKDGSHAALLAIDGIIVPMNESGETMISHPPDQIGLKRSTAISASLPKGFLLEQSYPNPFNPTTTISFTLPEEGIVSVKINNTLGEQVDVLANELEPAGRTSLKWNAMGLPSGTYYYKVNVYDPVDGHLKYHDVGKTMLLR